MTHFRLGDSLDKGIDMAAIVDPSQRKTIDEYVQKAKKEGAEVCWYLLVMLLSS